MIAVLTVLFVLTVSLSVVRVATVGLTLTGISRDLAQFQALSAFTGSGFTTRESEAIVNHPVRRRIVMHLMLLGNAGIVVAIASVLRLFLSGTGDDWYETFSFRLFAMLAGVSILWFLASSKALESAIWKAHTWALRRWTRLEIKDYTKLLHLARDYAVWEMRVNEDDWVAGQSLRESRLLNEGVVVLGIEKPDGTYLGTPHGPTHVDVGDCLLLYGQQETLTRLDKRRAGFEGNIDHMITVTRQIDVEDAESDAVNSADEQ
jgi:hypothetical protein